MLFTLKAEGFPKSRRSVTARTEGGLGSTVQLYIFAILNEKIFINNNEQVDSDSSTIILSEH